MTLKDILETGYGIDFSTLDFKVQEDYEGTKEEILESLENNEVRISAGSDNFFDIEDFDIEDDSQQTIIFLG